MMTITSINALMEIIENGEYNHYGLRGAHESDIANIERGYLDCSFFWSDHIAEEDEEQLNGTCAIDVHEYLDQSEILRRYVSARDGYSPIHTVLLIADNNYEYGYDENEVILGNNGFGADVIAIVKIQEYSIA